MFAMLTLAFIFLPSLNVIGALYGPRTAGRHGFVWGFLMAAVSGIWFVCVVFKEYGSIITIMVEGSDTVEKFIIWGGDQAGLIGFTMIVSFTTMSLGLVMIFSERKVHPAENEINKPTIKGLFSSFIFHFLLFPLLLPFSPVIFLIIKGLAVLKPKSELLKMQSTMGSRGEAILEAAPQFALQCYIALFTLDPNWTHYFCIITSALTLSIPHIEQYVTARSEEFGPKSILKNIVVFCPGSLFRILVLAILGVFLNMWAGVLLSNFIGMSALGLLIVICWFKLSKEKGTWQQFGECCLLSWLTITNLDNGKSSAVFRMVSSVYWTIVHTILLADIPSATASILAM